MPVFKFKQFEVEQDRCAQKIGTDAVLLGAWMEAEDPKTVLDVGTGTGVIALMAAQRFPLAQIEAVELDEQAFEQATDNFENSPWNDRLFCFHASFQEFCAEMEEPYDLIVSNPPFFDSQMLNENHEPETRRKQARFDDSLSFEDLIGGVKYLLADEGTFTCIIPKAREQQMIEIALEHGMTVSRISDVKGRADVPSKRSLIAFRNDPNSVPKQNGLNNEVSIPDRSLLIIEKSRHNYTEEYKNLTRDFYLDKGTETEK
ncbi:tRNA1(Val) (adenine(37)-N6)-methyltransferase [Nonlabens xiamenensis]|uniref:tRNA1(Val) (adenine(37)-N6)-methyltransferase n=1 Tax=Nonlabens xiamenensis TaxID=2341043 RepID=UPI000F60EDEA|nr:methyltransferase [Nonlabens xiamenensis]